MALKTNTPHCAIHFLLLGIPNCFASISIAKLALNIRLRFEILSWAISGLSIAQEPSSSFPLGPPLPVCQYQQLFSSSCTISCLVVVEFLVEIS